MVRRTCARSPSVLFLCRANCEPLLETSLDEDDASTLGDVREVAVALERARAVDVARQPRPRGERVDAVRVHEVALALLEHLVRLEAEHAEHAPGVDARGRVVDAARARGVGARVDAGDDARGRDDELLGRAEDALRRVEHLHAGPVDGRELGEVLERRRRRDVGHDVRRALVRGRVQHREDGAVAVHLGVADHRVVDGRRGAPRHEQQRQLLHLVERVKPGLAQVGADEVVVVEPDEPVTAARQRDGLWRRHRHADEELVDRAHVERARARVIHDAVHVAGVVGVHRDVRERLAVDAVLDDEEIERGRRAVGRGSDLGVDAVGVGAGVLALDAHRAGGAGGRARVKRRVEPEGGSRRGARLHARSRAGGDGPDVEHAADAGRDHDGRHRTLDDGLHLEDVHGAEVRDVAAAHRRGAGECQDGVRGAARDLHSARGALRVAREPDDAARRRGAPADDDGVDRRRDLGRRGVGDVGEVRRRECDRLLEAVVDPEEQRHAVGERVRACAACGHGGRRAVEDGIHVGAAIHGETDQVAVDEHEGTRGGAEQHARRGATTSDEEAGSAHGGDRGRRGDVGVVRRADHPELAAAVLEEAHRGQREVRVGREAAELRLEFVERRAEHGLPDGPALGEPDRTRDGRGSRGDAANLRLLLDDDDLGRQELSAHGAPRFFLALLTSGGRLASGAEVGVGVVEGAGRVGSATWCFTASSPRRTARTTSGTASTASSSAGLVTPVASVSERGVRRGARPCSTSQAHSPSALQYVS